MAKCRYQIMQNDSILYQDIADGNGRAAFNSELIQNGIDSFVFLTFFTG